MVRYPWIASKPTSLPSLGSSFLPLRRTSFFFVFLRFRLFLLPFIRAISLSHQLTVCHIWRKHQIDPLGRTTTPAGSDDFFRICFRPFVRSSTFQNIATQNKRRLKIMITTGGTMNLVEWIIDETCLGFTL